MVGDSILRVTANHPFWVVQGEDLENRPIPGDLAADADQGGALPGRWVNSHQLKSGDVVLLRDGRRVAVEKVELTDNERLSVTNLTVEGSHTFAVGIDEILVHNKGWCDVLTEVKNIAKPKLPGKWHGHHIVMKGSFTHWLTGSRQYVENAQNLLRHHGIDLLEDMTKASKLPADQLNNLTWAKLADHSKDYAESAYKFLKHKEGIDGTQGIKDGLNEIAAILRNGKKFRFSDATGPIGI